MKKTAKSSQLTVMSRGQSTHHSSLFAPHSSVKVQRGFTLLLAVLIAGILLAIGFAIYNIVAKDLVLSSSGRESQFAFYAADSGIECALYNDYKRGAFSTSSPQVPVCRGGSVLDYEVDPPVDGMHETRFGFSFHDPMSMTSAEPCVRVVVRRTDEPGEAKMTTIVASGYNTCVSESPRRTERALRVDY